MNPSSAGSQAYPDGGGARIELPASHAVQSPLAAERRTRAGAATAPTAAKPKVPAFSQPDAAAPTNLSHSPSAPSRGCRRFAFLCGCA